MKHTTPYSDFIQPVPRLGNEYLDDAFLREYLMAFLPEDVLEAIAPDLERFGSRVSDEIQEWGRDAELNEPELTQFDAWGKRVDEIKVAAGWENLAKAAAEEGLVGIGYERRQGEHTRLYQAVKLQLFTASSAIYTCPLAMSDGAARLIELFGDDFLKERAYPGLVSRDPSAFLTSGQWMTERTGGSDVSRSMTLAVRDGDGWRLYGHKWFTSAITADMAFTLASTGQPEEGKRAPLSLFYLPIRKPDGTLNGIEVEALKDKLGTRALPTAQLSLKGAEARMVGEQGKGVRTIATLFNITRIYNSISAVSYMRRAFALTEAYGRQREAFGKKVEGHVLFRKTLLGLGMAYMNNALLTFFVTRLLGREECGMANEDDRALLRLLTPITKLYTAKQAIAMASEHVESFGGIGYLEDSGIPSMLRDAQVLSIWEGTTNVLSLDMLRAMHKEDGLNAFQRFATGLLPTITHAELADGRMAVAERLGGLMGFVGSLRSAGAMEAASRDVAFYIAELSMALLWLEFMQRTGNMAHLRSLNALLRTGMSTASLHSARELGLCPEADGALRAI